MAGQLIPFLLLLPNEEALRHCFSLGVNFIIVPAKWFSYNFFFQFLSHQTFLTLFMLIWHDVIFYAAIFDAKFFTASFTKKIFVWNRKGFIRMLSHSLIRPDTIGQLLLSLPLLLFIPDGGLFTEICLFLANSDGLGARSLSRREMVGLSDSSSTEESPEGVLLLVNNYSSL